MDFWALSKKVILDDAYRNGRDTGAQLGSVVSAFFELIPLAVEQERFDVAAKYANKAMTSAKKYKDEYQVDTLEAYKKQLKEMVGLQADMIQVEQQIKTNPDDPQANTKYGQYLAFIRNDWETAIPCFARCDNPQLKTLAEKENQIDPSNNAAVLALADAWFQQASRTSLDTYQRGMKARSLFWYSKVRDQSTGIDKRLSEKMISQLELYDDFFQAYMDDDFFVQTNTWNFGLLVTNFRVTSIGRIDYREGTSRRSLRYTKSSDTYDFKSTDNQSYFKMRLQRDRRLELKKFDSATGRLLWTLKGSRVEK